MLITVRGTPNSSQKSEETCYTLPPPALGLGEDSARRILGQRPGYVCWHEELESFWELHLDGPIFLGGFPLVPLGWEPGETPPPGVQGLHGLPPNTLCPLDTCPQRGCAIRLLSWQRQALCIFVWEEHTTTSAVLFQ